MGLTINAYSGIPVLGGPSHRSASRKLIRSTPMCWLVSGFAHGGRLPGGLTHGFLMVSKGRRMGTLLIRNATVIVTMDAQRREIADGGLFVRDGFIERVGRMSELPSTADELLHLRAHLVLPALVKRHQHPY